MGPCPLVAGGVPCVSLIECQLVSVAPRPHAWNPACTGWVFREVLTEREPHSHPSVGASVQEEAGLEPCDISFNLVCDWDVPCPHPGGPRVWAEDGR